MRIYNKNYNTIWVKKDNSKVIQVIDQRKLPFLLEIVDLKSPEDCFWAIREMVVRGAPLIGVTAAFGMYLSICGCEEKKKSSIIKVAQYLKSARPTAVNLSNAVDYMLNYILNNLNDSELNDKALLNAEALKRSEINYCSKIGDEGAEIIKKIYKKTGKTVNILTHCNAGWLACIEWGTATAPIYKAYQAGIPLHVYVDETRPRNQGARLTAFELEQENIPYTVIVDNAGGHIMQHGLVDIVLVGSDRTTINGDVANKIGTYLKALAAYDNSVPFYVALPSSSIDCEMNNGVEEIPIEEREDNEVKCIEGWDGEKIIKLQIMTENSKVVNYGFDVTPARLITGLITEKGICKPCKEEIVRLLETKK